jgi:hypothetical protein
MKRTLSFLAAAVSTFVLVSCEVEEPKRKPKTAGSPLNPSGGGDLNPAPGGVQPPAPAKPTCAEQGKKDGPDGCVAIEPSCAEQGKKDGPNGCVAIGKSCAEQGMDDGPSGSCVPKQPGSVVIPGRESPIRQDTTPVQKDSLDKKTTLDKKALKNTFLITTVASGKNCYLPEGAIITIQAPSGESAQNKMQIRATVTNVKGAECQPGTWNYFREHLSEDNVFPIAE